MEAHIIKINGISCLIIASCMIEAKIKAIRLNGLYVGEFPIEDFKTMQTISKILNK
jgi:hypothetical protein